MPGSKASGKRQTRITFTPLPSSSPATKGYNKQIQERAAAVSYDGSPGPAKRRKVQDSNSGGDSDELGKAQLDGVNDELPTPGATGQSKGYRDEDSEDAIEPARSGQRRTSAQDNFTSRSKRSRQQQLDFTGARDSDGFSSPVKLPSSTQPHSSGRAGIFGGTQARRKRQPVIDVSSDESEGSDLPSPRELIKNNTTKANGKSTGSRMGNEQSRVTRNSQRPVLVQSDSDKDNIVVRSNQRQEIEAEESDDEMPTTLGRQPRTRARRTSVDSFISSPPRAIENDDDLEIIEQPKKRRRVAVEEEEGDEDQDEDEDEDEPVTPRRRTLKRPHQMSRREQEDLDEDLEFLGPSSDVESSARAPRNTQTTAKNKRQHALELLKRKRSGQPQTYDDGHDEDTAADGEPNELYDVSDDEQPQITSSRQMFNANEDDEEFIDEDEADSALLGVPEGLPLKYTRYASMKAGELFKYAVEWMVQKKINPAFQIDDEIYSLTFQKLNDEVKGLAASKFVSSVWRPKFVMALQSRPEIALAELDRTSGDAFFRDKCEACNRTSHVPTWEIQFRGAPYHPETLDEVAGNEDDESDESEEDNAADKEDAQDKPTYNYQGREVPPESTTFYVGRFCKANAETAHALSHWRYDLYECVVTELIKMGYNTSKEIVKRDRWSTKKRRKYANKIVDRMEAEGTVKKLWRVFRDNIDLARSSKQGRFEADSP